MFRNRYADLPRILRESPSIASAISKIATRFRTTPEPATPIAETLLANAINGLSSHAKTTPLSASNCPDCGQFASADGSCTNCRGQESNEIPRHIQNGSSYTNTQSEASSALQTGFSVEAASKQNAVFGPWLKEKYQEGKGRKDGPDPSRLEHLAQAVATVKYSNQGAREVPGDQIQYRHRFKGGACVVFTSMQTGRVNGFIYEKGRSADRLLLKYKMTPHTK